MIGVAESDVAIVSVGAAVPDRILTNDEISLRVETDDAWIRERTGIRERRIAADGETVTTMAIAAAQQAIDRADMAPAEIDLVLAATASPERAFPSIAAIVADAVGAHQAGGVDLLAACAGFAYGLATAISHIHAGLAENVLVIGTETLSRITDWDDRGTCILFGDGAGAVIVRRGAAADAEQVVVELGVDGSHGDDLVGLISPAPGEDVPPALRYFTPDHGVAVEGPDLGRVRAAPKRDESGPLRGPPGYELARTEHEEEAPERHRAMAALPGEDCDTAYHGEGFIPNGWSDGGELEVRIEETLRSGDDTHEPAPHYE